MKKVTSGNKFLKIGMRTRLIFLAILLGYLWFRLSDYSHIVLSHKHIEMEPSIKAGQSLYIFKRSDAAYQKGDIIFAKLSTESDFHLYRIFSVNQGDVEIKNGQLFLDGVPEEIANFHLPTDLNKNFPKLKKGEYFLIHDNQTTELVDSIVLGAIAHSDLEIKGKVFFYWPEDEESK
jgi:signal peptidase I